MSRTVVLPVALLLLTGCASEEPDTRPPEPPEIVSPSEGVVLTSDEVIVQGTAESGAYVDVYVDGDDAGAGASVLQGTFVVEDVSLGGHGAHAITARATDGAGNRSGHSAPVVVYVDLDSPSASIWSPAHGSVLRSGIVEVVGIAEGGVVASLEVDGSVYGEGSVDAGIFTFPSVDLGGEGTHTLRARAADLAGNEGPWGSTVEVTVDYTAPAPPELTWPANGSYLTEAVTDIRGRAAPGCTLYAYVDGAATGAQGVAVGDTFEVLSVPLGGDGLKSLTVTAVDAAQNMSQSSAAVVVRVDTDSPLPPAILHPADGSLVSCDSTSVSGIADDGGVVTLWISGAEFGETTAQGWEFRFDAVPLSEGENAIFATVQDLGDRESEPSDTVSIRRDTWPPSLQVSFPPQGYQCASESVDVQGTTEVGAELRVNGWLTPVGADGSFATRSGLTPGANSILVAAADSAGNSTTVEIAVDSYPTAPALELLWPTDGLFTDSTTVTVVGTTSPWATVTVQGSAVGVDSLGGFSGRVSLSHGVNTLTVIATSPVGVERRVDRLVISDTPPSAPAPLDPPDGGATDHGRPRLVVSNAFDPDDASLIYTFVVYQDAAMTQEVRRDDDVTTGPVSTAWTLAPALSLDGSTYWWRCQAGDGYAAVWSQPRAFSVPDIGGNLAHRYLGFGDSITAGAQWYNGWWITGGVAYEPELEIALAAFFGDGEVVRAFVPGGLTYDVLDSLPVVLADESPAYCLLHVGTLDATLHWTGFQPTTLDSLELAFEQMVDTCRQRRTLPVLSTVTPLHPDSFSTFQRQNVDSLNARIRGVAAEDDVMLADHYAAFIAYADGDIDGLLSGDGRHLSDLGYSVMAAEWFRAITGREPGQTEAAAGRGLYAGRAGTAR